MDQCPSGLGIVYTACCLYVLRLYKNRLIYFIFLILLGSKASATIQPFLLLHLNICPELVGTIEDALKLFSAPETLEGYRTSAVGKVNTCNFLDPDPCMIPNECILGVFLLPWMRQYAVVLVVASCHLC